MQPAAPPTSSVPATRAKLRILATTDLHMHLLAHDYFSDADNAPFGLARVASRIAHHRSTAENCLLFDNGDLLQGNLLADFLARDGPGANDYRPHPAIALLDRLGYDAATLGNHDFSHGIRFLRRALAGCRFPVVLANARFRSGRAPFTPCAVLDRMLVCDDGSQRPIRLGVIGFLPPQTPDWEPGLAGDLICSDAVEAANHYLPQLRAAGCCVIIALCHGGIEPGPHRHNAENCAAALARLDVDVVIAGHTHLVFPGPDIPATPQIDTNQGRLAGKPAVMPGFWGSHLGVIDLQTTHDGTNWRITNSRARAEPCGDLPPSPDLPASLIHAHRAARRHFSRRVGRSTVPLCSHFTQLGHDAGLVLIGRASRWYLRQHLRRGRGRGLPIVTAVAPFRSGGRSGPDHYTDIQAGTLSLRALTDLYLFPNRIAALRVTGAMLADWLERASAQFNRLGPGTSGGDLLDPRFPGYNFDVILGLQWQFDLGAAPLYDPSGQRLGTGPGRVRGLRFRGRPLDRDAEFILATNSYRLGSHGVFSPLTAAAVRLIDNGPRMRDILATYLRHCRQVAPQSRLGWGFAPMPGTSALFRTAPHARPPADTKLHPEGVDQKGFAVYRLDL